MAYWNALYALSAVVALMILLQRLSRYRVLRRFSASYGCQDAASEILYDYWGILKIIRSTRSLLKKTALANSVSLFEKYGDTYTSRLLAQKVFFTCDPRNIKHVLVTRFVDYDSSTIRAHLFRQITERGIFAVDGPEWKVARDRYRNQLSHTRSIIDLDIQEQHFQNFLRRVPSGGKPFDLQILFSNLILDLTTAFALGESLDSLNPFQSDDRKKFVESLLYVKKTMARDGFLGPVHLLLSKRDFYRACGDVHRYIEQIIHRALEKKKSRSDKSGNGEDGRGYNLLQGLTENTSDVVELRDGVITILIAGIESVASLLSTTFWLLARDERVYQKLRASILDSIGQDPPTYDQLKSLTYLRYVLNEAMRVYPPVPFNARRANKDTTLPYGGGADGGSSVLVQKGERLAFSSWASHRSLKAFGPDAHQFWPERWENLKAETLGFIPFNIGPRACPGQQYALMEASYVAVRILQTFPTLRNHDSRGWKEKIGLNLSNENGVIVGLERE